MSKSSAANTNQLSFLPAFEREVTTGSAAWGARLRALLQQTVKISRLSRDQVAERMAAALGEPISLHQLNAWLANSKPGQRFPAEYLVAFCQVTGNIEVLRDAVRLLGGQMASAEDLRYAEVGRTYVRRRQASRREKALLDLLENGGGA